ncbi:hypothetical protein [Catellatospora sp. NPDC049133]|uniref:hypothetical protein n=1 Tax=Catellatospora sp. NPDC049133 TaxID=3155499 RepID=UPI0033E58CB3
MSATAAALHGRAATVDDIADVFVLHRRALRPGAELEHTARYRDDVWHLDPATHQQHQRRLSLHFTELPARYRQVAKQLFYNLLSGTPPHAERPPQITTIRTMFTDIKRFALWLDTRPGHPLMADLTPADLEDYQRHLIAQFGSGPSGVRRRALCAVRLFWRHRHALTPDRLAFDPRDIDGWGETGTTASENITARIPEAVCGPLLAWALRFVDDFAPDILAAERQWRHLHHRVRRSAAEREQALRDLLDAHMAECRPLPGRRGRPHINLIAAMINDHGLFIRRHQQAIDQAVAVVGLRPHDVFDQPITGRLDGRPWIDAIVTTHRGNPQGLACLARMLQAACYITVAYLSGMRDSEVKHLRRGCLYVERDPGGVPYRWKATSLAFKTEPDPAGTTATWTVGAAAARAIAVLEQLQRPGVDLLFTPLPHGPGGGKVNQPGNAAAVSSTTNTQLRAFIGWVNDYCAEHGRHDGIPDITGRTWRLMTSQFRRTLAWYIARRPGGAIAGAIAYRHLSIQMFEGYAGTSDSGFRAEVESEQALARGEHLMAMIDAHDHDALTGPAADDAARRLAAFAAQSRYQGMVVTDRHRLKRLMDRHDPAVYPGAYVTCVYDHAKALCQQNSSPSSRAVPDFGTCRPLGCRNVALTEANTAAWQAELERIDARLVGRPPLPPLLHQQLITRRETIDSFISQHQREAEHR